MTGTRKILRHLCFVCAILLIIGFEISVARGGRSGGRSGGARYSSYRSSSYRSSSYRSSSYRSSSYRNSRSSNSLIWKAALIGTVYYGSKRYMSRRRYYSDTKPEICENNVNIKDNGTGTWGKFVCPLGEQADDYGYCCGQKGKQRCCKFFDDPGRTAGVVIGVLLLFGVIGLIIFCVCRSQKRKKQNKKSSGQVLNPVGRTNGTSGYPANAPSGYPTYPAAPGYPPAETTPGYPPSYTDKAGMPPSYEKSGDLPYSPNPTGFEAPYPTGHYQMAAEPMAPYPTGPYPMAPHPNAPSQPQHLADAPPYSVNPIGFTGAPGQPDPPQGYGYNNPNVPGQGYTAPNAVPPPYLN